MSRVLVAVLSWALGSAAHPSSLKCYPDAKSNRMRVGATIMGYPVNLWSAGPSISVQRSLPGSQSQDEFVPGERIDFTIGDLNQSNSSAPTFIAVRVADATGAGYGEFVVLSAGMNWTAADAATTRTLRTAETVAASAEAPRGAWQATAADGWKCPYQFFAETPGTGAPPTAATATWVAPCSASGAAGASITITVLFGAGEYASNSKGFVGYVNATTKVLKRSTTFDCAKPLGNDFGLAWKLDTVKASLTTMLTYSGDPSGTAWIGWGLSDKGGGMIATTNATVNTAVIANVSGTEPWQVGAYELDAKSTAGVVQADKYTKLVKPVAGFENNVSFLSFQQRTDQMKPAYNSFGKTNHIIFAAGQPSTGKPNTGAIGYHAVRNATTITWSLATPTPPPTPPPGPPPPTTPRTCTCCASWCTRSGVLQPDGAASSAVATAWTLSWRVSDGGGNAPSAIDFAVEINAAAWVGFGIPSSGMDMVGAYAVLCKPGTENAVGEFFLGGYDVSTFRALAPELLSADLTQQTPQAGPARTICQFRRNLTSTTASSQNFSAANSFIIAAGSSNTFGKHAAYFHDAKEGHIDWQTGNSSVAGGAASLTDFQQSVVHHAIMMVLSWGLLIPTGVLSAKFRGADPVWFKIHRAANMLGLVAGFIGLGIIVAAYNTSNRKHFVVLHAKIGLAVMVICGFQPLNAFVRPSKKNGDRPSVNRLVWELCHKGSGYAAVILAWVNIFLAADLAVMQDDALAQTKDTAETAFYLLLGGLCCAAVVTSVRRWQATDKRNPPKGNSDGITGSTSLYEGM